MRRLVGVALLSLLVLILVLLIPPAVKNSANAQGGADLADASANKERLSFGLYSSEISDRGNGSAAVLQAFATGEGEGEAFGYCSDKPIPDAVLILKHPSVPGLSPELSQKIALAVEKCGFSYNIVSVQDALLWKDAVIIAPTGALPQSLENESARLSERNLRLVVVESLDGRVVDAKGGISQRNASIGADFESVAVAPSRENEAALLSAKATLAPSDARLEEISGRGKEITIAIPAWAGMDEAYCRIYRFSNSSCRFSDSGKIEKPMGTLSGEPTALSGEEVEFEFSLGSQESGRRLLLYAVDYAGREEVGRKEVANGVVSGGWEGKFSLVLGREGGHTIWLVDQYGRRHASAFVEVRGFSAKLVGRGGNRLLFEAGFGGEPLTGPVLAWIDDGEKKQFYSSNGTLVVWASPSPGVRTLHLSYLGMETGQKIEFEESALGNYLRLLVPSLLFLLAVFLLLRANRKVKYRITFPEFVQDGLDEEMVLKEDFLRAWERADGKLGSHKLPAYSEEIGARLAEGIGNGRRESGRGGNAGGEPRQIEPQSLLHALRALVKQGEFLESEGLFIPARHSGGFSAGQLRSLRLAHDLLLERGIAFTRKKIIPISRFGLEIAIFSGEKSALAGIGARRRIVLFESAEELAAFRRALGYDRESVRIKLAEQNGKVSFAVATRRELEGALP